jgi:hypothetical protein
VGAFLLLGALGGDCLEEMERRRQDQGLATLVGYTCPTGGVDGTTVAGLLPRKT